MDTKNTKMNNQIFLVNDDPFRATILYKLLSDLGYQHIICFSKSADVQNGFDYDAANFFKSAVDFPKCIKAIENTQENQKQLKNITQSSEQSEIYVKANGGLLRIPFENILFFENLGDYIKVITCKSKYVFHGTIKSLEKKIKHPRFMKIHRSFIVNLDYVKDIKGNNLVIEKNIIPISRAHKPLLLKSINIV